MRYDFHCVASCDPPHLAHALVCTTDEDGDQDEVVAIFYYAHLGQPKADDLAQELSNRLNGGSDRCAPT